MCGIAGSFGKCDSDFLRRACRLQHHRGPDDAGIYLSPTEQVGLAHTRLSIIDLSAAGHQPMVNHHKTLHLVFNGEIYNYRELRRELGDYPFTTHTDTEVILAAYERWGDQCVNRFSGMFAFLIWDSRKRRLFAARDRFGVKPLYYCIGPEGVLYTASETRALREAIGNTKPNLSTWATYLAHGHLDHSDQTFWSGISSVPPGYLFLWEDGKLSFSRWYDLPSRTAGSFDERSQEQVEEEYLALLDESIKLRFRADVPVGINLSGGLDSSVLLSLVSRAGKDSGDVKAFTFATGDPAYDELPWVKQMLARSHHSLSICRIHPGDVPHLSEQIQQIQDEPFGGLPTLAYARLFEQARSEGTTVLLDGQGMDEQWAGYDYYASPPTDQGAWLQGSRTSPVRPDCLTPEFRAFAQPLEIPAVYPDRLRSMQFRDIRFTKIPRTLRFNDRVSMCSSTELREPFLDHRLFELALRQPEERKIWNGTGKRMLRSIAARLLPQSVATAPKRPLQTPQREWLRAPLRNWALDCVEQALASDARSWFHAKRVRAACDDFMLGNGDNSFNIWQWISVGMIFGNKRCGQSA